MVYNQFLFILLKYNKSTVKIAKVLCYINKYIHWVIQSITIEFLGLKPAPNRIQRVLHILDHQKSPESSVWNTIIAYNFPNQKYFHDPFPTTKEIMNIALPVEINKALLRF